MKKNFNSPANPRVYEFSPKYKSDTIDEPGFSKLELASIILAGHLAQHWGNTYGREAEIARNARALAEAVLEETDK